jgi:hypothetical protein
MTNSIALVIFLGTFFVGAMAMLYLNGKINEYLLKTTRDHETRIKKLEGGK